jgi:hypothetical protein
VLVISQGDNPLYIGLVKFSTGGRFGACNSRRAGLKPGTYKEQLRRVQETPEKRNAASGVKESRLGFEKERYKFER